MNDLSKAMFRVGVGLAALGIAVGAFIWAIGTGSRVLGIGGALVGCSMLLLAGLLLAPTISDILSSPFGSIYFPSARNEKPPPHYSLAEAKVQRDDFEGALADYVKMTLDHPEEVRPYCEMVTIILQHLRDPERAEVVYHKGLESLKKPEARDVLERHYQAAKSRAAGRPEWGKVHTVEYREDEAAPGSYRDAPEREHVPNPLRTSKPKRDHPD